MSRIAFLAFAGLAALPLATHAATTERASVPCSTSEAIGGASFDVAVSGDGRFVAFASDATNLAPDDTNGFTDVFVRDRKTGLTTRVSVDSAGTQGGNRSADPAIAADGRFVAFTSLAKDLVAPIVPSAAENVYVHDRKTGATTLVSVNSAGVPAAASSQSPAISADGR